MVRHIVLARRPSGVPSPDRFRLETGPEPTLPAGGMIVAGRVFSIDPAIRGFLDDRPSYLPPVAIGAPVNGMALGEVLESDNPAFPVGALVRALATWSERYALGPDALGLERVSPAPGVPIEHYMGALGPVGLTAWVGLHVIGAIRPGDTVVVSAAAGATGSTAAQLARAHGCRVIGLVGTSTKVQAALALGLHCVIDYRATSDLTAAIRQAAPAGVDVYFDNVGGPMLELMLPLMRLHGRIVVCGMIGQYNHADHPHGVTTLWQLVVNRLTMRGFLTYDHADRLAEAQGELDRLYAAGQLTPVANIRDGFDAIPSAFIDLMAGRTIGKTLVRV